MEFVTFDQEGAVGHVRLNRPGRHNGLVPQMWHELRSLGARLLGDGTIRCLVLSGNGPSFCSGIDRKALAEGALTPFGFTGDEADRHRTTYEDGDIAAAQNVARWLTDADFVTIAAVHGYALGAGAQLAMACDLRVVATDAQIALPEVEIGLFPEMSAVATLPRQVGYARALELALTGRRIDAAEAFSIGLANAVVSPEDLETAARDLAGQIASARSDAIRYCKRAMQAGAAGDIDGALRIARAGGLLLLDEMTTAWSPET